MMLSIINKQIMKKLIRYFTLRSRVNDEIFQEAHILYKIKGLMDGSKNESSRQNFAKYYQEHLGIKNKLQDLL